MEVHAATIMINGTVGAGKTTAASALALLLEEASVAHAVVDTDEIRRSWPAPPGDRFNLELQLANLTALSTNYRAAGADVLVASGVVESADALERYKAAAGGQPKVVARLTADHDTRAAHCPRHADDAAGATWHLRRTVELEAILSEAGLEDFTIDAARSDPHSTAKEIWTKSAAFLSSVETTRGIGTLGPRRGWTNDQGRRGLRVFFPGLLNRPWRRRVGKFEFVVPAGPDPPRLQPAEDQCGDHRLVCVAASENLATAVRHGQEARLDREGTAAGGKVRRVRADGFRHEAVGPLQVAMGRRTVARPELVSTSDRKLCSPSRLPAIAA